jgi:hypothetical protein
MFDESLMAKPRQARTLSLSDIAAFRVKVLESSCGLISDAELLFKAKRYARAFSLSVIAIEEASKIPYLLECSEGIVAGNQPNWSDVHRFLHSHHEKLMANLMNFKGLQVAEQSPSKGHCRLGRRRCSCQADGQLQARRLLRFLCRHGSGGAG